MIDSSTAIIFLDKAFPALLQIDDWKMFRQGGFTSYDVMWTKARGFHCTSSMYISCQTEIDFGAAHDKAMARRLHKYNFRSPPRVKSEAKST